MAKKMNEPDLTAKDETVTGPVAEAPAKPMAPSKLEAALKTLTVEEIPVGRDALNRLNYQVQLLDVRVRALEGRL